MRHESAFRKGAATGSEVRSLHEQNHQHHRHGARLERLAPGPAVNPCVRDSACVGGAKDDAPAEIHLIGSIGGLPPSIFDPRFQYAALGHLHAGFRVAGSRAWYSGTPVALNIKEARTPRRVIVVDTGPHGG